MSVNNYFYDGLLSPEIISAPYIPHLYCGKPISQIDSDEIFYNPELLCGVFDKDLQTLKKETTHLYIVETMPKTWGDVVAYSLGYKVDPTISTMGIPATVFIKAITDGVVMRDGTGLYFALTNNKKTTMILAAQLVMSVEIVRGTNFGFPGFPITYILYNDQLKTQSSKPKKSEWSCSYCGRANHYEREECKGCGAPRMEKHDH